MKVSLKIMGALAFSLLVGAGISSYTVAADRAEGRRAAQRSAVPQVIEPFIEADAIALGKWLVLQKVDTLSAHKNDQKNGQTKSTVGAKPAPKSDSTSAQKTTQTVGSPNQATATRQPSPERQSAATPNVPLPPAPSQNLTVDSALEMRVALAKDVTAVSVAVSNGGKIVSLDGRALKSLAPGRGYLASQSSSGLNVDGSTLPTAVWIQSDSGYVAVGDRWYRGRILLLSREQGVLAVNYVMLREYLYSVVGAEMSPSWSQEALKAQAVAARSYALVHNVRPASNDYDLDDTTRYQAYRGVMTEANTTQAAVQATAGEFISHNGGIVESLYAATQDIVDNAHSGYGMSQTGALSLAQQGYRYHQILATYYPQTAVGRLDIGE